MLVDGVDLKQVPHILDAIDGIQLMQRGELGGNYRCDRLRGIEIVDDAASVGAGAGDSEVNCAPACEKFTCR